MRLKITHKRGIRFKLAMKNFYAPFQPLLTDTGLRSFSFKMQQCPVSPGLRGIVHSYLQISTPKISDYPVIPDGTQALYVSKYGTMISGGLTRALELKLPSSGEYFGIRFFPGALRHLFRVNINEIGSGMIDGKFLPSPFITHLHETIFHYAGFHSRAKICDKWLLQQKARQPLNVFDQALDCIYKSSGNIKITQDLSAHVGVSSRHLNRLFQQHTGLSTKSFAQTIRFQHACKYLSEEPENSLKVALETGYFDQAHLLKEFKARLNQSPVPFFNRFTSDLYNRNAF